MNDRHFNYITKEKRNIEISVSFTSKFLPNLDLKNMIWQEQRIFHENKKTQICEIDFEKNFFQIARVLW
jgi:hypothetical protein